MKAETLRELVVLAQYRNFTVAAGKLYMAQSRLSGHISELEKELGFEVFVRGGKRLDVTPAGRRFLIGADKALGELEAAIEEGRMISSRPFRTLNAMKAPLMEQYPKEVMRALSQTLKELERREPNCRIRLFNTVEGLSELDAVEQGVSDLCFLMVGPGERLARIEESGSLLVEKLLDVEYRAWVDPSHPIADRGHATLRDLVDYPIVLPAGIELTSHRCAVKDLFVVEGLVPVYNSFFNMDKSAMFAVVPRDEQVALSFGYMERTFAKLGLAGVAVDTPHRASICVARSASGGEMVGSAVDDIVRLISEAPGEPGDSLGISLDLFS